MRIALALISMRWRLLLIAVAMAIVCPCEAVSMPEALVDNPYKINDELYKMYSEAYRKRAKPEGITLSQRMYDRAVQMGDKKAQCIALTIPVIYYTMHVDEPNFEKALKALQDRALATGYEQYYYFGVTNKINMLINQKRLNEAFNYASKIESEAQKHKSMYGTFTAFNALGQLHSQSFEHTLAIDCYKRALQLGTRYLKGQDMAPQYRKIAECYEDLYDYRHMLEYAERGYNESKSVITKTRSIRGICYAAFMLGRYETFLKYYNIYEKLAGKPDPKSSSIQVREIAILKLIYDRRFDEAEKSLTSMPLAQQYSIHIWRTAAEQSRFRGDYKSEAFVVDKMYRQQIRMQDSVRSMNISAVSSNITNMLLDMDNQRLAIERQKLLNEQQRTELHNSNLELANTQLSLNNSDMELQRTRSESKFMRYSYSNKQLEADKLRAELETQQAQQRANDLFGIVMAAVAVGVFVHSHNRLMARLRQANAILASNHRELTEAKNHAEAANRAKTTFINNMEEDIRTPLNAVVAYSNAIADSAKSMTPAERQANRQKVLDNTNTLLQIVSNVINKAQTTA